MKVRLGTIELSGLDPGAGAGVAAAPLRERERGREKTILRESKKKFICELLCCKVSDSPKRKVKGD